MSTTTEAALYLSISGDSYELQLLPPGLSRRRLLVTRERARGRSYEVKELASRLVRCGCRGFQTHGHCKHVDALRAVGLIGTEAVS